MHHVASVAVEHHEIAVGVGALLIDNLRQFQERQVCRDDAHNLILRIVQGLAIGCQHAVDGQLQ